MYLKMTGRYIIYLVLMLHDAIVFLTKKLVNFVVNHRIVQKEWFLPVQVIQFVGILR